MNAPACRSRAILMSRILNVCAHLLLSPEMVWTVHTAFRHLAGGLVPIGAGSGSTQGEDPQASPPSLLPTESRSLGYTALKVIFESHMGSMDKY